MSSEACGGLHQFELPTGLNDLPDGWQWVPLSTLVRKDRGICYGIVQPGKHDPAGVPMVNTGDIFEGHASEVVGFRVAKVLHQQFKRSTLEGGELLVTLVGANFGRVAIAPKSYAGFNCSRAVGVIPIAQDVDYVMFALRSPVARYWMDTWANTTAQPTFNLKELAGLPVPLPPPRERRLISNLLLSLDYRITLLRQTNATIAAIAQALFKSWFVDFDPVRAKMEGRVPEGMDEATAALFPSSFYDSEFGAVPSGWAVQSIGDVVTAVGGATPDTKDEALWQPPSHHWTTPKDLSGLASPVLLSTERKISDAGLAGIGSGLLPVGTLLMSSRAPIGYLAVAQVPVAINQGYIAFPPGGRLPPVFMLFWCRANMDVIKAHANGSTFMEISKKAFRPILASIPPEQNVAAFVEVAGPLLERIAANERQAQTLAAARDTLLPRLISGQLRVEQAAEALEPA